MSDTPLTRLWDKGPRLPDEDGRYIPKAIRDKVEARDGSICQYCGREGDGLDHIYPWANGGSHHHTNLVVCCRECNSIGGLRVFMEFMRKKAYILARRIELYGQE